MVAKFKSTTLIANDISIKVTNVLLKLFFSTCSAALLNISSGNTLSQRLQLLGPEEDLPPPLLLRFFANNQILLHKSLEKP